MPSIVLADQFEMVRTGVRCLLEQQPGFCVVGEASNGLQALTLVHEIEPDVLIRKFALPGLSGLGLTSQICHTKSKTRVVFLSQYSQPRYVLQALANGAYGFVALTARLDDLVQAILTVCAGEHYLSPSIANSSLVHPLRNKSLDSFCEPNPSLTPREQMVMQLVAEGYHTPNIARLLSISPRTVEVYRANFMHKLNLHSHSELIRYALTNGLLPQEDAIVSA